MLILKFQNLISKIAPYTTAKDHTYKAEPVAQAIEEVIIF
jgi:hypothetical protein